MTPWWNEHTSGLIGAIAGSGTGLLGGLIGTVAGIFAPRGKLKSLVYGLFAFALTVGIIALAGGLIALALRQPYRVWYPLVLIGCLDTFLYALGVPMIRRAYQQADARRLEAQELRRS